MFPKMSYEEYLAKTGNEDTLQNWVMWKVDMFRMEPQEATKAAYDPEWGYEPLPSAN